MKRAAQIVFVNSLVLAAGIVVLELIFGGWFDDRDPFLNFTRPRNVKWSFSVPWDREGVLYTRDRHGLRGRGPEPAEIVILTMGGSTTDQRYVSDSETWQEVLERQLNRNGRRFDVINAGIDGQSTVGHIKNFSQWIDHIPDLDVDYVLFFIGINEFYLGATNRFDSDLQESKLTERLFNKSALISAARTFRELLRPRTSGDYIDVRARHYVGGIEIADYVRATKLEQCCEDAEYLESLAGIQRRIGVLANLTRDLGAEPIFVTQRTALWYRKDGEIYGAPSVRYDPPAILAKFGEITGVDRYRFEESQSRAVMSACRRIHGICVDLFSEIDFDLEADFYDSMHNRASGADKIGRYLSGKLQHLGRAGV